MRALVVFILSLLTNEAFGNPLADVARNQPTCMSATFSPDYMARHPNQQTSAIWMKIYRQEDPADPTTYLNLQLTVREEIFRTAMICDKKANGSLHCAVECDGGQAEIWPNDQAPMNAFFVNKGIYITSVCDPIETPIFLEASKGGDDIFDLQATACEAVH